MTEDEARAKRCPYLGEDKQCVASDCMAWRVEDEDTYERGHRIKVRAWGDEVPETPEGYEPTYATQPMGHWEHVEYERPDSWFNKGKRTVIKAWDHYFMPDPLPPRRGKCGFNDAN